MAKKANLGKQDGVLVNSVFEGQPAALAGMKKGDIILKIAGAPVSSPSKMIRLIGSITPGQQVQVEILREGKHKALSVELTKRVEEPALMASLKPSAPRAAFGFDTQELDAPLRRKFDIQDRFGMVVTRVAPGGLAEEAGLKQGDLISAVNGHEVMTRKEYDDVLSTVDASGTLFLLVIRQNETIRLTLERGEG